MGITNNKQKMTWLLAAVYIFILVWQDIVMEISEQIRKVLPQMPGRSGDELLMGITEILYLYYELDKSLIPQVKENGKLAGRMLAMVEGTLREYLGC